MDVAVLTASVAIGANQWRLAVEAGLLGGVSGRIDAGARFGGISTQVVAATLVTADAAVLTVDETQNAELIGFACTPIGGALEARAKGAAP